MRYYAGIGSRKTPLPVLQRMKQIAADLRALGWTLRSGGADGADAAFAAGAGDDAVIYLPWSGFNGLYTQWKGPVQIVAGHDEALHRVARDFHPAWSGLSMGAKALHTRNVAQVLGQYPPREPKSEFVVCWTPGGKGGGGTGQAIRIANGYKVPVFDLASDDFNPEDWK